MKKIILIFYVFTMSLVSFAGDILTYEVLRPAENPLPKDVQTMTFVYRNYNFSGDTISQYFNYNGKVYFDENNYKKNIVAAVYAGFRSVIEPIYKLDSVAFYIFPEQIGNDDRNIPNINWKEINEICKPNSSDIVVSLNDVTVFNNYNTWYDGDVYVGVADVFAYSDFTIYDPLTESFLLRTSKMDSLQTYDNSTSLEYLTNSKMPHREDIMTTTGFMLGEQFAKRLLPQWETISREYFSGGSKELRQAATLIRENEYGQALEIYKQIVKAGVPKESYRALFNMAIIYERESKIAEAIVSIKNCIGVLETYDKMSNEKAMAEVYLKILQVREKELKRLNVEED